MHIENTEHSLPFYFRREKPSDLSGSAYVQTDSKNSWSKNNRQTFRTSFVFSSAKVEFFDCSFTGCMKHPRSMYFRCEKFSNTQDLLLFKQNWRNNLSFQCLRYKVWEKFHYRYMYSRRLYSTILQIQSIIPHIHDQTLNELLFLCIDSKEGKRMKFFSFTSKILPGEVSCQKQLPFQKGTNSCQKIVV